MGYTVLMLKDEEKDHQLLKHNRELLKPLIPQFRGEGGIKRLARELCLLLPAPWMLWTAPWKSSTHSQPRMRS